MRLICPNCDAQYNVADDAIPEGGRDVQCSSCAHTWFQTEKPVIPGRDTTRILTKPLPNAKPDADDAPEQAAATQTAAPPVQERKKLDFAVANILREEAGRSTSAPDSENATHPATQAETRAAAVDTNETLRRIARMTEAEGGKRAGTAPVGAAAAATAAATAEANLRAIPDINEINAALRARAEASDRSGLTETEKQEAVQRSGFRRGFFFVLIVFAILIAPYFFADQISDNLPQTRSVMATYVQTVDDIRIWLNAQAGAIASLISGFTGAGDAPGNG